MAGRLFLARLPSLKAPEASGGSRASLVGQDVVVVLDDIRVLRRVDQRVVLIGGLLAVFAPAEPAGSLEVHLRPVPGASKREQALQGSPQGSGRRRSRRRNRTGRSCGTSAATRRCRMPGGSDANHSRVRSSIGRPGVSPLRSPCRIRTIWRRPPQGHAGIVSVRVGTLVQVTFPHPWQTCSATPGMSSRVPDSASSTP